MLLINKVRKKIEFTINYEHIFIFLFTLFWLFLVTSTINSDLVADELYHSHQANFLAFKLLMYSSREIIILGDFRSNIVLWVFNLLILLLFACIYQFYKKIISNNFIYILFFVLVFKTILYKIAIEYGDPHPPLRLLPLWLGGIIFGFNDFGLRVTSSIALSILGTMLYSDFNLKSTKISSFIFSLTLTTIPLLIIVGSIVEQSIYSILIWTIILLHVLRNSNSIDYNYLILLASLGSLLRSPTLAIFVPIFIILMLDLIKNKNFENIKLDLKTFIPVLICIPYVINQLIHRTPSTTESSVDGLSAKIYFSLHNYSSINYLIDNLGFFWVMFIPIGIILSIYDKYFFKFYIIYIISIYVIFYSINIAHYGHFKYQAEIGIPLIIIGFIILHDFICKKFSYQSQ